MKVARTWAVTALLLGAIGIAVSAAAGTKYPTIFVANGYDVTAYPTGIAGDVAPIALTTDMAVPSGIARDSSGRIYVTNAPTNTVTVYAASANGNVPPIAVIGGSKTRLANPNAIALDASGKIYVLSGAENRITVYSSLETSTGILNEAPIASIAGSKTRLDNPAGIALDSQGDIYVANDLGGPVVPHESYDRGTVTIYPAGSHGNVTPIATISGAATGLAYPVGIAVDSSGNIYVSNSGTANTSSDLEYRSSITVYPAGSNGNAPPSAVIAGDNTGLSYSPGIALDASRNLYAAGYVNGVGYGLNVYPAGSNGNVSPSAGIVGADTGLDGPYGIALDSSGNIYVANGYGGPTGGGSVTVYPAGSSGDAAPATTITSSFNGIDGAFGIAVDSAGHIYVANQSGGPGGIGSVTIYSASSHGAGPPIATIAGDNTGLNNPIGIAVDSSGSIFVLNGNNSITVYPAGSSGDVTPKATFNIDGSGKNTPAGIAVDADGNVYVANQGGAECFQQTCYQTSPDSIAIYRAGSHGNTEPSAVIVGPDTQLATPSAIAVDRNGDIYVANQGPIKCTHYDEPGGGYVICGPVGASVTVYGPSSSGDVTPIATISGAKTELGYPNGIAVDAYRNIYVLNFGFIGQVQQQDGGMPFARGTVVQNGRTTTREAIPVGGTVLQAVAIYQAGSDAILIFGAGSDGDVAPAGVIGGPYTGLYGPSGIAFGPGGP
jgi:sugar lactone lactonase YvrE